MGKVIYMDYQATTPCDQRVLKKMLPYFCEIFGNPHSTSHVFGENAANAVQKSREQIANLIGASDAREIIFTSGATESNNIAIQGVARFYKEKGKRIITSSIEHKCVMETFSALKREGFDVVFAPVLSNGIVDIDYLKTMINDDTTLVSIMAVNNEIGVCQPINEISEICKKRNVFFHTDASQAIGKIDIDVSNIDLMSISGHKIYGPKGIGALYVRIKPRVRLAPLFFGGGQERGIRSGTLPTALCVGIGEACEIAHQEMVEEKKRITDLRKYFLNEIFGSLDKVYLNGDPERNIPGCINISFEGVEGEAIMLGMPDVCISSGSACTSESLESSYVLAALNTREELAHSSLRIGFGRYTTLEEVKYVSSRIVDVVTRLRSMSPLWNS